ncbi:hypothetical protein NPIL_411 [Nephila pilipes]|uniref:Uncharacterized protein n=1 Tax=Nephila pilipes TaxID=299642 RepID=A0A8X6QVT8_NEPPI|nr:hypothetical protein NPIL_411 [Nephila pilipes]
MRFIISLLKVIDASSSDRSLDSLKSVQKTPLKIMRPRSWLMRIYYNSSKWNDTVKDFTLFFSHFSLQCDDKMLHLCKKGTSVLFHQDHKDEKHK